MKICHVITRMIVGGAQENTLLTIRSHVEKGYDVTLVTGPSPGREGELLQRMSVPGLKVVVFPELVRELSPMQDLKAALKLRSFFRRERFDVVHTHSSKAGIVGRWSAHSAGVPVVVHTVHGQAFHPHEKPWKNKLYILLERFAARYSCRIFAVAQAMIDQCVAAKVAPREKYKVVYSGMDMGAFSSAKRDPELRAKLNIPENAKVIVSIARLFPLKGYEFAFPALKEVLKSAPDTVYLIIGDGPEYDRCHAKLERDGIAEAVRFAGLIPPDKVPEYLAQGDLLWHLSLREGLPRAAVQALAEGIPVIGFALDGTPEVVLNGETGYAVTPENISEVVARTLELWNDPERRRQMGAAGKALVLERFDHRRMGDILEQEYLELLQEKQSK